MPRTARSLDRYPLLRSQNVDEMCAALERVYAKPALKLAAETKQVDVTLNHYQAKDIAIAYTKYGIDLTAAYPENDFALQTFPVRGRGEVTINNGVSPLGPCNGVIVSPGMRFAITLNANYEHFVLVVHKRALTDKLSALTGATIQGQLRFNPTQDRRDPSAKALRDHFFFLVSTLSTCAVPLSDLVLAEFEQTLVVMFLHANRHNYSHLLERDALRIEPRQIRQAEEYIEANWQQTVTLEKLAEITGVSAFSLFNAFRKHRGYSPLEFVARLRSRRGRA